MDVLPLVRLSMCFPAVFDVPHYLSPLPLALLLVCLSCGPHCVWFPRNTDIVRRFAVFWIAKVHGAANDELQRIWKQMSVRVGPQVSRETGRARFEYQPDGDAV
jgi:hypothetical protein